MKRGPGNRVGWVHVQARRERVSLIQAVETGGNESHPIHSWWNVVRVRVTVSSRIRSSRKGFGVDI